MKNNTVIANEVLHLIDNELEFEEYKRAAKQFFNEIGEWSYDEWKSHNAIYFDNALKVGAIIWGLIQYGDSLGWDIMKAGTIELRFILAWLNRQRWHHGEYHILI